MISKDLRKQGRFGQLLIFMRVFRGNSCRLRHDTPIQFGVMSLGKHPREDLNIVDVVVEDGIAEAIRGVFTCWRRMGLGGRFRSDKPETETAQDGFDDLSQKM